jgi:hypothetical protein
MPSYHASVTFAGGGRNGAQGEKVLLAGEGRAGVIPKPRFHPL